MRLAGVLGILMFAGAPATGAAVLYTFDVTSGGIDLSVNGTGHTSSGLAGTFAIQMYAGDAHIGESDTFVLKDSLFQNTEMMAVDAPSMLTATVNPGKVGFVEFLQPDPAHIGPGGTSVANADVRIEATILVTEPVNTTWDTVTSAGKLLPISMVLSTSVLESDILEVSLGFSFPYQVEIAVDLIITLDMIVDVVGTAHVVPDPAFGGFAALGLTGAAAWLGKRRV